MASISTLVDRVKIFVQSSGTGPFQLGAAVKAYRGVEALIDGATYSYAVESGGLFEVGTGVYLSDSGTLVRNPQTSSNGGAPVSLPANVELNFTALAQDIVATGASLPIVQGTGASTQAAMSQAATTTALNSLQIDLDGKASGEDVAAAVYDVDTENLFQNTDYLQGTQNNVVVPNDALDSVALKHWVAQQTGLSPLVSQQSFVNADGLRTLRVLNGVPATGTVSIGTGNRTFTLDPGLNVVAGFDLVAVRADDPLNYKMSGTVVSYNGTTGVLVLNVSSVVGSGTFNSWVIGRNGVTTKATPVLNTVSANVASGATVLPLASTTSIERGANVEEAVGNGIAKATYVVSKTTNSITLSRPTIAPIASGYQLTTYGDQGWYLYQNIAAENAGGFKNGTPGARTSFFTFKVKSFAIEGVASLMALGYSSLFTLGRAYATTFPVTTQEQVVTVPILGDVVGAPNTWDRTQTDRPYMTVGLAWVSRGTNTSKNIPPNQWVDASPSTAPGFASAGAQGQTLDLGSVVGAWVEISEVDLNFGSPRRYKVPTYIDTPAPFRMARAAENPYFQWFAEKNGLDLKNFIAFEDNEGNLCFQAINDAETGGPILFRINRDNSIDMPGYPDGAMGIADGKVFTAPEQLSSYISAIFNGDGDQVGFKRSSLGDAAAYRKLSQKGRDQFDLRDYAGLDLSGQNAATTIVQAAVNAAINERARLHVPIGLITLDAPIGIGDTCTIVGENCGTGKAIAGYLGIPVTRASRFHLAHDGIGFLLNGNGDVFDWVLFENIMTSRIQPQPTSGVGSFVPGDQDYDFAVSNAAGLQLRNVCLLNPARGIDMRGGGSIGRLWTDNLMGQPLRVGVNVELAADVVRLHNTHFWPFWQDHIEVARWTLNNCDHLFLKRCDTPLVSNYFSIGARTGIRIGNNQYGGTTKLKAVNVDIDYGATGIHFDDSAANCWASFSNLTIQGAVPTNLANTPGVANRQNIRMSGAGANFLFVNNVELAGASGPAVNLTTGNQRMEVGGNFWLQEYGGSSLPNPTDTRPGISVAANSSFITNSPVLDTRPGLGPLTGGAGRIDGIRQTYTPAVTAQAGAFTTLSQAAKYLRSGVKTSGSIEITFSNVGTGTGFVQVSLPDVLDETFSASAVNVTTGAPLVAIGVQGSPGKLQIQNVGGGNVGVNGHTIVVTFDYNRNTP